MLDVDKSTSLNFPDPRAAFLKGIASMQISETVSIKARAPKEAPISSGAWRSRPSARRGTSRSPIWAAGCTRCPKQAKNKADAWKLLEWLNSPEKDYELCKKYDASPRYKVNWEKEPFKSDAVRPGPEAALPLSESLPINLGLQRRHGRHRAPPSRRSGTTRPRWTPPSPRRSGWRTRPSPTPPSSRRPIAPAAAPRGHPRGAVLSSPDP